MNSLSFPDVNVWLALTYDDHVHRSSALDWWHTDPSRRRAFSRITQMGVLRLLTTSAAMGKKALTMAEAWAAYDRILLDQRVVFLTEPRGLEQSFRAMTSSRLRSPKLWADAYVAAFAEMTGAQVVTFDRALAGCCRNSRLLTV